MIHGIIISEMGPDLQEATIIRWLKTEGEIVDKGDILLEIETSKAAFEIEAEEAGVLARILVAPGEIVGTTNLLGVIIGEDVKEPAVEAFIEEQQTQTVHAVFNTFEAYSAWHDVISSKAISQDVTRDRPVKEVLLTPAAKRLVRERGLDAAAVAARLGKKSLTAEDMELTGAIANRKLPAELPGLVPIKAAGRRPPLFCAHPHDGRVLLYHDLARNLGADQPVYGFQAIGPEEVMRLPGNLVDLAAGYVAEMVSLQPEGPYYLCGYCSGGALAFEMACQLETSGRKVALLAIIDAYAPDHPKPLPEANALTGFFSSNAHYLHRVRPFVQYLSKLKPRQKMRHLCYLPLNLIKEVLRTSFRAWGRPLPHFLKPAKGSIEALLLSYRPLFYKGQAVLFRPTREPLGYQRDPSMGWDKFVTGGLDVVEVPGYYQTLLFKPRSRVVAGLLRERLEMIQAKEGRR